MTILYNRSLQTGIRRKLRKESPKSEKILWQKLKNNHLGYKFRRQYGVGKYVIDFYCPAVKVAIEIDGITHEAPERYERDQIRDEFLTSKGIRVERFASEDIFKQCDLVIETIFALCEMVKNKKQ